MRIDKVGWQVPSIGVAVNYFTSLNDGETVTTLDRDIVFTSTLTADQPVALREVAANCPISRLLGGQVTVRTFVERTGDVDAKEYAGEGFVVEWGPDFCQHSTRCWTQLNNVFNPTERPWIHPEAASADRIEEQVRWCPTGALGFRRE